MNSEVAEVEASDNGEKASKYAQAVREASRAAAAAPEEFRARAFEIILSGILEGKKPGDESKPAKAGRTKTTTRRKKTTTTPSRRAESQQEQEELERLLAAPGEVVEKYAFIGKLDDASIKIYAALRCARDECDVDGLTEGQLRQFLQAKFRENIPRGTVAGKLSTAPAAELNRVPLGRKTRYQLMRGGEEKLDVAVNALENEQTAA